MHFINTTTYEADPRGGKNTTMINWATNNAKYGWSVEGVFPRFTEGAHINHVEWSKGGELIATADENGLINVFRNPCRVGHKPISIRGHSE